MQAPLAPEPGTARVHARPKGVMERSGVPSHCNEVEEVGKMAFMKMRSVRGNRLYCKCRNKRGGAQRWPRPRPTLTTNSLIAEFKTSPDAKYKKRAKYKNAKYKIPHAGNFQIPPPPNISFPQDDSPAGRSPRGVIPQGDDSPGGRFPRGTIPQGDDSPGV